MIVRNPHFFEFHYRIGCPYCYLTEYYLLNPLRAMGVIRFVRINISHVRGRAVVENLRSAQATGDDDIAAPTIFDRSCKHIKYMFIPFTTTGDAVDAVATMAENMIDHLCRHVQVYNPRKDSYSYLSVDDVMRDPLIKQLVERRIEWDENNRREKKSRERK